MNSLIINNQSLGELIRPSYSAENLTEIRRLLVERGTLDFPSLRTGLFSASIITDRSEHTGYRSAWVRDNVQIAYAHYFNGRHDVAVRTVKALSRFFHTQRDRFESVIDDPKRAADPMNRPHVRFDGDSLQEVNAHWAHAQNDALGYFLWLYCLMANEGIVQIEDFEVDVLSRFPRYFEAIRYWEDEDSGHWEEVRKVSASSIGVVVAGLRELKRLSENIKTAPALRQSVLAESLDSLLECGVGALRSILPFECVQTDVKKRRRYDSALLFLVYPLHVVEGKLAETIVHDIDHNLQGDYGIKRYKGDSFWCTDYKRVPMDLRTVDYSNDIASRDTLLVPDGEAQWCLFDPMLSAYFGTRYQETRDSAYLERQSEYLNRSLGQITGDVCPFGEFKCAELYYKEEGRIETSDATPLLWTQANLWVALNVMEASLRVAGDRHAS